MADVLRLKPNKLRTTNRVLQVAAMLDMADIELTIGFKHGSMESVTFSSGSSRVVITGLNKIETLEILDTIEKIIGL
jgi:hypothetical protein